MMPMPADKSATALRMAGLLAERRFVVALESA